MSKSSPRRPLGRQSGTVTVIEDRVYRSSARNARLAFIIAAAVVGLLSAIIAADNLHPILAALLGALIGIGAGATVWVFVRVWPVIRLIWWWLPEILLASALVFGWIALARSTNLVTRLVVVALLVGIPAGIPVIRRRLVAVAWCVIVRHRLRVCFAQFIRANSSGSLPLILTARPTPVGERVWIYLRPGLSFTDLNSRLDKIAVACHASTVVVEKASEKTAALLRVDIKRRDVLTDTVDSPLPGMVDPATPTGTHPAATEPPAGLDLPDVATTPITVPIKPAASKPAASKPTPNAKPTTVNGTNGDDITDWI